MSYESAKARLEAATEGPWSQGMAGDRLLPEVDHSAYFGFVVVSDHGSYDGVKGVRDAEFIAHSKQDLEAALEVVRTVTAWFEESESGDWSRLSERYNDAKDALKRFEELP